VWMSYHRVQLLRHRFVVNHHLVHLSNHLVHLGWVLASRRPWMPQQVYTAANSTRRRNSQ
jgi:hypothetical protein